MDVNGNSNEVDTMLLDPKMQEDGFKTCQCSVYDVQFNSYHGRRSRSTNGR